MAKPERVLRLSGVYHRKEGVSEKDFHDFLSHRHGVECAKIHAKYDILKYQMAFSSSSAQALAKSMELPYKVNNHDLEIEYYFKDVAALLAISADEDFKALHVECEPYIDHETTTVTLTWIEVYLEDGKLVNVDVAGKSLQPSFEELSDIKVADKPVANYYDV
ncbi:hypothetical protein F4821DRAFT_67200 [Hypoxylon rubiginosum]|uniref:Uncharacterized protein n=1 Tax=Hypoxylon rubiginosum TaxID=110542 RepID=A0ACC0D9I6_9PEZI|nr:hypothetical protein F4821DRAFT_67200 [Hypoxylon rubiginosum]